VLKRTCTFLTLVYLIFISRSPTVSRVTYVVVRLVTLECTREVINPLYHCRHNARDRNYGCDRNKYRFFYTTISSV